MESKAASDGARVPFWRPYGRQVDPGIRMDRSKSSNSNGQSRVVIAVQISDRVWLVASSVDRKRTLRGPSSPGRRALVVLVPRTGRQRVCSIGTGRRSIVR